jgi:hypothetical protein
MPETLSADEWRLRVFAQNNWIEAARLGVPQLPVGVVGIRICFDYPDGPGLACDLLGPSVPMNGPSVPMNENARSQAASPEVSQDV